MKKKIQKFLIKICFQFCEGTDFASIIFAKVPHDFAAKCFVKVPTNFAQTFLCESTDKQYLVKLTRIGP